MTGPGGDFGRYWLGRTASLVGDYAFRVAFIAYVIDESGSPGTLAVANAVLLVPAIACYLLGGVIGDRVGSRRRVLIGADLFRAAVVAGAAAGAARGGLVPVVVLALLVGVGDGFFQPASFAWVTEIVEPDRLVAANSANSVGQQVGIIGGPLLGGVLVATGGPPLAFAVDAGTFLLSAALLATVRSRLARAPAAGPPASIRADLAEGLRYTLGVGWLLRCFAVGAGANAVFAGLLDVTVPFIVAPDGSRGAPDLGGFYAMQGVGALVGAGLLARVTVGRVGAVLFGTLSAMGGALALVGAFGAGPGAYAMAVVFGLGTHLFNSLFTTLVQQSVPPALLSRVSSVVYLAFTGLIPVGTLLMGPLVTGLGARATALAAGSVVAALCLLTAATPGIRALALRRPEVAP